MESGVAIQTRPRVCPGEHITKREYHTSHVTFLTTCFLNLIYSVTYKTRSFPLVTLSLNTLIFISTYAILSAIMRVPYVSNPPETKSEEHAAIVKRIEERRAPRPLQSLDLALLHSPHVADGWNSFLGAVRTKTSLSDDIRELAISRIAVCNKAWYEWKHHAPLAVKGGVSEAGLEAIKGEELGERPAELSEKQWAVLLYTDEMTRNVQVKDETFDRLREYFNEQEIVEITATVRQSHVPL